jgi:hypothetical protein
MLLWPREKATIRLDDPLDAECLQIPHSIAAYSVKLRLLQSSGNDLGIIPSYSCNCSYIAVTPTTRKDLAFVLLELVEAVPLAFT